MSVTQAATLVVTSTVNSGPGTLREALALAMNGDTIDATGVTGTILLTSGELVVNKSVSIIGSGPAHLAVDGNAASRVFHIGSNTMVSLTGLTITNGFMSNSVLFTTSGGGGIYNNHATLTVSNCNISGNSAVARSGSSASGGGIFNDAVGGTAILAIANSTVNGNRAGNGGGIANDPRLGSLTVTILNCTLSGNVARFGGGGIDNSGVVGNATLAVINSILSGNSATNGSGGAIRNIVNVGTSPATPTLTVVNSVLNGNSATRGEGGGIYTDAVSGSGTVIFQASALNGNSARSGGGIYNVVATKTATLALIVNGCTISSNSAVAVAGVGGFGGGVLNDASGGVSTLTIANCTFSRNSAGKIGGGIFNAGEDSGSANLQIVNSTLSDNSTDVTGGSICNHVYDSGSAIVEVGSTILKAGTSDYNITNYLGTVISHGFNLCSDDGGFLTNATDLINTDPMLGPLQDNGGPTLTHALLPGSPAIDRGFNFTGSVTDQRDTGFGRTVDDPFIANALGGDGTDIGAFEVQQVSPPKDGDGDGVTDDVDECPDTPPGDIVSSTGCSIAQLVPCDGPRFGGSWKNHGQYVRAMVQSATHFLRDGLVTRRQWAQIVTDAANSKCGWNRDWDYEAPE